MQRLPLFLLLALVLTLPALADGPRSFQSETLTSRILVPTPETMLQTSVRWGEIEVRGHDTDEVIIEPTIEVDAATAARLSDTEIAEEITIKLVELGDRFNLVVDSTLSGFYSVNLSIAVPRGMGLALEVRDGGNIHVDGVGGEVEISNRNGSVQLDDLVGGAVVHARNGSITAAFASLSKDLPLSFSTLNGSVDVTFPEAPSADVRIRYNRGGVESDFPIVDAGGSVEADTKRLDGRKTQLMTGRIGDGGPRYYFHTANGTVYLRQRKG